MLLRPCFLATLGALFLVGNAHAVADFSSLDGSLEFKNFILSDVDESFYDFEAIDHGFKITILDGRMTDGDLDAIYDLNVAYDVWSNSGPIVSATLSFEVGPGVPEPTIVDGVTPLALVAEDYFALPKDPSDDPVLRLTVYSNPSTSLFLDEGPIPSLSLLRADKDIQIRGSIGILSVTQTYTNPIPEPSAALLFGLGAGTLGLAIRRRQTS